MKTSAKKGVIISGWRPIRKGERYCSSSCGGGCLFVEFEEATRRAETLALELGDGWVPHVWEDLGWQWRVLKRVREDRCEIRPVGTARFLATLSSVGPMQFRSERGSALAALRTVASLAAEAAARLLHDTHALIGEKT